MIDAIIVFSIRHRTLVIGIALLLAVVGSWSAWHTPIDAIPDLSENQVIVFTDWKGHGPREIEDQVTFPITLALTGTPGARVVRSSSEVGFSTISAIFEDSVPMSKARSLVAQRMATVHNQLPAGISPQLGPDSPATGQIFWYTVESSTLDTGRLRDVQDWYVRPRLASVVGVADVSSVGGHPIEFQITPDPNRLRVLGVPLRDLSDAVAASNLTLGAGVVQKANAEFIVRSVGQLGTGGPANDPTVDPRQVVHDLEQVVIPLSPSGTMRLGELASISIGAGPRRGVLEKDGNEVVGGVVLMTTGENPLEVTQRIKRKIDEIRPGLPKDVRIIPFYDRTPLIQGAIATVTRTVLEAMGSSSLCVLVILLSLRASLVIVFTIPLAALASFLVLSCLRVSGVVSIQANAMSLAGIAISIGVLVDSSIVMAENVMHRLQLHFGDQPVRGDVRHLVLPACLAVGRPIVFSVVIMLISFLPVFALEGMEGKMFRPLAYTKTFALAAVALLAITVVPALCTIFIRGRLRAETDNPLVRGVIDLYRPVLTFLFDRPAALAWFLGATLLVGFAPLGERSITLAVLFISMTGSSIFARSPFGTLAAPASLVLVALVAGQWISSLEREFLTPLDEGMLMDMPITAPRASVTESVDDLKARDMVLCRFPEVDMVVGKAGRADTPTDPAPLDMIETMVSFRPRQFWPRRKLRPADATKQVRRLLDALIARAVIDRPINEAAANQSVQEATPAALALFDSFTREFAYHRNHELLRETGGASPSSSNPTEPAEIASIPAWQRHMQRLDEELLARSAPIFTRLAIDQILDRSTIIDPSVTEHRRAAASARARGVAVATHHPSPTTASPTHHHSIRSAASPQLDPHPTLEEISRQNSERFMATLLLWKVNRHELTTYGGELDQAVQMPGWTNVWTMPIQNRVDMLATGVNTPIGIRILGPNLDDVLRASDDVARVVKQIPGAADVIADPVRGKPTIEVRLNRERAAMFGVLARDFNDLIEIAVAGKTATMTYEGRERHPVVLRFPRDSRQDEQSIKQLLVPIHQQDHLSTRTGPQHIPLGEIADVRVIEGPASIKSENGLIRNYVRLSPRGRDAALLVSEAQLAVKSNVRLPDGVTLEWTGQFEHSLRARDTLAIIIPIAAILIFLILYATYHDFADALLIMLAVPGAIAGGLFFQWLLAIPFSITVAVGYIACFGMATSTGIIMLVYLREAVAELGGIDQISLQDLRNAVIKGAVQRLRPKLLTEGTVVLGLAPMLWSDGVGSEVIRPMAAPVLGGILVADEVIDLFIPVLFYWVRRWRKLRGKPDQTQSSHAPEC